MEAKKALRKHFLQLLNSKHDIIQESNMIEAKLENLLSSLPSFKYLGLYSPLPEEPQIDLPYFSSKYQLALPRINDINIEYFYFDPSEALKKNKYGILEPKENKALIPDVIIIPGLAFDHYGARLGRGKGYFDRYLCKTQPLKNICVIGVCFEFQILPKLPLELHDHVVNYIITEQRIIQIK
ncbi:MAG: 5-formyltetrahydrofolate cyclo-ligase [Rickettsiaceae bacterium]|jgi:5-formyltetrahydrofolate cyclo-ligase|nr:5-formyltetrahydrofolate cyclo-ligase [Rickettsiaceae bacterium]